MDSKSRAVQLGLLFCMGSLVPEAAKAEVVIWQFEGEVQGLAVPSTTEAYFPRALIAGDKVTFRLVVDTATPVLFPLPTEALYRGAIKSATASGDGWSIEPTSLALGSIEVRNEEPPGRDAVFFAASSPEGQGQTWYSFQPVLYNIDFSGGAGPLSSVAIPSSFTSMAAWNNSYFYFSARRDLAGQQVDGATYIGRLLTASVLRDRDSDGILDSSDNCPGAANPGQADANSDGYGDACVHPTVRIPTHSSVNHFVLIERNALIERGVTTAENVSIGTSARLDYYVNLGTSVSIGDFSRLGRSVRVGNDSIVGSDVEIERSAVVLDHVQIDTRARIAQGAVICSRATIGTAARLGRYALIQSDAVIPAGAVVPGRATAPTVAMCLP